jgi:uncharacterized protein
MTSWERALAESGAARDVLPRLVGFARHLRSRGLPVGTGRIVSFCRAAAVLDPTNPEDLYWAGRTALISRRGDIEAFEQAFLEYFGEAGQDPDRPAGPVERRAPQEREENPEDGEGPPGVGRSRGSAEGEEAEEATALRIVASPVEVLRQRPFDQLTEEEWNRVARLIRRLAVDLPTRRTRRLFRSSRGPQFDFRRTVRRSLRTDGEPLERLWRTRGSRARALVLVLDVSGSMAAYSRPLLQFAFAAMRAGRRVEVFCFGTRLTRVTRALRGRDPGAAIAAAGAAVLDWEGGTRIGESLHELMTRWGQRSALRGAVVVLCSDGLERGDPEFLADQMGRLARLAHRVVWVNPLKGSPRYEPLARGMASSLPFVDVFLSGHNLESLEALSTVTAR